MTKRIPGPRSRHVAGSMNWFGHPVYALDFESAELPYPVWRYCDTRQLVEDSPPRPCPKCKKLPTAEGHDPCIADLPGVANACCGHGVDKPHVQFESLDTLLLTFSRQTNEGGSSVSEFLDRPAES